MNTTVVPRLSLMAVLLLLFVAGTPLDARPGRVISRHTSWHAGYDGDRNRLEIDLEDSVLVITHRDRREKSTVEITAEYELYIDGKHIETTKDQKELLAEYYDLALEFKGAIKRIGKEGAKIGISGAALGLKAVGGVFKLLSPHYDSDDLERDLERDAERIEERAEKLEQQAGLMENIIDDLDEIAYDLTREIPELDDLGWF